MAPVQLPCAHSEAQPVYVELPGLPIGRRVTNLAYCAPCLRLLADRIDEALAIQTEQQP